MRFFWLIFTDLDGTLLDEQTYSFEPALPAIRFLTENKIPIIACTSKTHLEVMRIRRQIGLTDPFIVENGSAVLVPPGYFAPTASSLHLEGYETILLGKTHDEIWQCFEVLRHRFQLQAKGFSEMTVREIREYTSLPEDEARLAKKRFFSEPFVCRQDLLNDKQIAAFLKQQNCRLLRGNRFFHLLGNTDKGKAVKVLLELFQTNFKKSFKTMGLGDSKNDLDLLTVVDQPVLIKKSDGTYGMELQLKNLYKTQQAGPAGWREAIEHFVK